MPWAGIKTFPSNEYTHDCTILLLVGFHANGALEYRSETRLTQQTIIIIFLNSLVIEISNGYRKKKKRVLARKALFIKIAYTPQKAISFEVINT